MLKWILRVCCLAVSLSLLTSELSYSDVAFAPRFVPFRFVRHRNFLLNIEEILASDKLGARDARFRRVPGLAGKGHSFESVNFPGHFWRHQNFRLKLHKFVDDKRFREDATFFYKRGLGERVNGRSFESFNFRRHYIRQRNFELILSPFEDTDSFRADATFIRVVPPK